jgi:type IV pilus assembly protein PilM
VEEKQRELATSRLLDIIRKSGASPPIEEKKAEALKPVESDKSTVTDSVEKESETEKKEVPVSSEGALPSEPLKITPPSPTPQPSLLDIVSGKKKQDRDEPPEEEIGDLDSLLIQEKPDEDKPEKEIKEEKKTKRLTTFENIEIDYDLPVFDSLPVRLINNLRKKLGGLTTDLAEKLPAPVKQKIEKAKEKTPSLIDVPKRVTKKDKIKPYSIKRKIKGKQVFAIDIGTSSVKLVELVIGSAGASIIDVGIYHFPLRLQYEEDDGFDLLISKAVRELLPASKFKNANLHLLLPDRSIYLRRLEIPEGDAKERLNAIKFQINRDLPFPLDVCEITYRGWNPKESGKQEVEVLAVDSRELNRRLKILEDNGLTPTHITAAPASVRFLLENYKNINTFEGAIAVADIGAAKTTISILEDGELVLCRTIANGGNDFTSILYGLNLGPGGEELNDKEAEEYKIKYGLPSEGDAKTMRTAILMRPIAERIAAEISRSVEFYTREKSRSELHKLVLIGGGAKMRNLPEFLSENLGVSVVTGDPLDRVETDLPFEHDLDLVKKLGPTLLPAIAVALDNGKYLNFIPEEFKKIVKLKAAQKYYAPAAVIIIAIISFIYSLSLVDLYRTQAEYDSLRKKLVDLNKYRSAYLVTKSKHDNLAADINQRKNDFELIAEVAPDMSEPLKALSHLVPASFYLDSINTFFVPEVIAKDKEKKRKKKDMDEEKEEELKVLTYDEIVTDLIGKDDEEKDEIMRRKIFGKVMSFNGMVYPLGRLTEVQFANFVYSLESSGWFRDVAVQEVEKLSNGKVKFKITCGL